MSATSLMKEITGRLINTINRGKFTRTIYSTLYKHYREVPNTNFFRQICNKFLKNVLLTFRKTVRLFWMPWNRMVCWAWTLCERQIIRSMKILETISNFIFTSQLFVYLIFVRVSISFLRVSNQNNPFSNFNARTRSPSHKSGDAPIFGIFCLL